jgi:hypothetical protein
VVISDQADEGRGEKLKSAETGESRAVNRRVADG